VISKYLGDSGHIGSNNNWSTAGTTVRPTFPQKKKHIIPEGQHSIPVGAGLSVLAQESRGLMDLVMRIRSWALVRVRTYPGGAASRYSFPGIDLYQVFGKLKVLLSQLIDSQFQEHLGGTKKMEDVGGFEWQ